MKMNFRGDGTFIYTGEGQEGDMEFKRGNRAIRDHEKDGYELHLFEDVAGDGVVTYLGQFRCEDWFHEHLPDTNNELREAIRFKLTPIGGTDSGYSADDLDRESAEELYRKAESSASGDVEAQTTTSKSYSRSEVVKRFARKLADGVCQGCNYPAPLIDKNGEPVLEVHHVYRRSDSGIDHPDNVIAICPNCHRRAHLSEDSQDFNGRLIDKVEQRSITSD
jgi:5-methylcytosine-specific restriction protein A